MALSYEFSIGSVRARENALLGKTDIEQLLGCKSVDELCRLLEDKGYGSGSGFDELIERHSDEVWVYLKSVAPDFEIFSPSIVMKLAWSQTLASGLPESANDCAISLVWWIGI